MRKPSGQTNAKKRAQYDTSSLGEVVGAYLRHGAALDALDDHLATPVTAVGDRDASPRAELFQD
jgi:hypothetical protein